jgi:small subunit ribosomal protein S16
MVKIRLTRVGSKKNPHYRLIVVPARTKRNTKALEIIGSYDPKNKKFDYKKDRITYWRSKGAQLTDTVERLLGEKPKRDYTKFKRVIEKKAVKRQKKMK